ncbi:conserved hypothetical protein [Candidatus Terasakiella magnetica]|nr:conserved hypothetical protein [Candidatus Terasakiella magnetica]
MSDFPALAAKLRIAGGPSPELDAAIAEALGVPAGHHTESVEECRRLVSLALPGWRLHLGFDVCGVLPYAVLSKEADRAETEAPTVPLAILRVLVDVLIKGAATGSSPGAGQP